MNIGEPFYTAKVGTVGISFSLSHEERDPPMVVIQEVNKALGEPFDGLEDRLKEAGMLPRDPSIPGTNARIYTTVDVTVALSLIGGAVATGVPLATGQACVDAIAEAMKHWLSTLTPNDSATAA